MKSINNKLNSLLTVLFLLIILQTGCSTTVKKPLLLPIEPGVGLSEITDPNQFPDFRDDYDKETLLYSITNSIVFFNKVKSYPNAFSSIGFTLKNKQKL